MDQEYRNSLQTHIKDSENAFDKKLFAISTGGLSLLFGVSTLNNHLRANIMFYLAAISFCISLGMNLWSHLSSAKIARKMLENDNNPNLSNNEEQQNIHNEVKTKNATISKYNIVNFWIVIVGILLSFIYIMTQS